MSSFPMRLPVLLLPVLLYAADHGHAEPASHDAHAAPKGAPPAVAPAPAPAAAHASPAGPSPVEVIARLAAGNARFAFERRTRSTRTDADAERRSEVAPSQHPVAAILTCADSRVPPEILFDQTVGDLFVVRNAGNVAEPVGLGSLEYGVEHLGIRLIIVLGHGRCGAVKAVSGSDGPLPGNLVAIQANMSTLRDSFQKDSRAGMSETAAIGRAVERNAISQASDILSESLVLKASIAQGSLMIMPAVYDLDTGLVTFLPAVGGPVSSEHRVGH